VAGAERERERERKREREKEKERDRELGEESRQLGRLGRGLQNTTR